MSWALPDIGVGENDIQSILFASYLSALIAGIDGTDCVLSGGAVTAQGSPNMTVAFAKAAQLSNGVLLPVTAGNVTVTTADATNPRLDLIVGDSAGAKQIRTGTPAAAPKPPARSANDVVYAVVYVPAGATTITTARIYDLRVTRTVGPITIYKTQASVSFDTTSAIQTYLTLTIPNGLFLAGRVLRLRCAGEYGSNSGTPTYTLSISYGNSVIFADATGATTADPDSGAWQVECDLVALTNTNQKMHGRVLFQTPGGKTAPTTGDAGDLAVLTHVVAPIQGALSIDSDAADRVLLVRWTMSVSNVAVSMQLRDATVELL